jgi:TatA/E family protein of Tat protein translocase
MSLIASFMNLAGPDLIVILLIILVLFGAKKLRARPRMGQAVKEFQRQRTNSTMSCTKPESLKRKANRT